MMQPTSYNESDMNIVVMAEADPAVAVVPTAVADPSTPSTHTTDLAVDGGSSATSKTNKKRRIVRGCCLICGVVTAAILLIPILINRISATLSSKQQNSVLPSPAPTPAGDEECRMKRVKIAEICNAYGLGDELVELKILVNDNHSGLSRRVWK